MSIFSIFQRKERRIVEVDRWNGSASNYVTPEQYANASLINFNTTLGRSKDEWVKDLIALPVRRPGDSKNTYVKQAVQAASGGRGITRVTRPEGVSQDDFVRVIKEAANEIIRAYEEWGGIAPDSVYELAGKSAPEERAVAMGNIYDKVNDALILADMAEDEFTYVVDMYYDDTNNNFFLLAIRNGEVVKMNISYENEEIVLGEFEPIVLPESLVSRDNTLKVYRDKDGKRRWLQIASVATLNRVGEIDSTKLYDSFIAYATVTRQFPILNVYHLPNSRIGEADFLARDAYVYIASGVFDDNEFANAVYETLSNDTEGYWGNSIEFDSYESVVENFDLGGVSLQTRVHTVGINTAISILPEKDAASVLTAYQRIERGGIMNDKTKAALLDLFKDEELLEEFEGLVGRANAVAANRISRSVEETEEVQEVEPVEEEEVVEEVEEVLEQEDVVDETERSNEDIVIELGETFIRDLTASEEFRSVVDNLFAERLVAIESRMNALENRTEQVRTQAEEVREWVDDVPAVRTKRAVVSYRARNGETQVEEKPADYRSMAEETLNSIFD